MTRIALLLSLRSVTAFYPVATHVSLFKTVFGLGCEQDMQLRGILHQASVTCLAMFEQILQHMELVLDLCAYAGLGFFQFSHLSGPMGSSRVPCARYASSRCAKSLPCPCSPGAYRCQVASVIEYHRFFTAQQLVGLSNVGHIASGSH